MISDLGLSIDSKDFLGFYSISIWLLIWIWPRILILIGFGLDLDFGLILAGFRLDFGLDFGLILFGFRLDLAWISARFRLDLGPS